MPIPKQSVNNIKLSARERIYKTLSGWIIDGTLKPGEKLNEIDIAEYFQVSRTPVREALQLLADQKLVDMFPSRGCFISEISVDDADEVYLALSAVNGTLTQMACSLKNDGDLAELRSINNKFKDAFNRGDKKAMIDFDRDFHLKIAYMAANSYLMEYAKQLHIHAYRYEYAFAPMDQSYQDHQAIIDAIESGNKRAATKAIDNNFYAGYIKRIRSKIKAHTK